MRHLHRAAPGRGRAASAGGFSMVEVIVSFALFLSVAAFITWAMTVSFSARASSAARADITSTISAALDTVAQSSYDALLSGDFTVPDPCPSAAQGITGQSCVNAGTQQVVIAYRFTAPGDPGALSCTAASLDPVQATKDHGYVQLQGCLVSVKSAAFAGPSADVSAVVAPQTRAIAPPVGQVAGGRAVTAHLSGTYATLPGNALYLVDRANPSDLVAASTVAADGSAQFRLAPVSEDPRCTPASPCALGLSVGAHPTVTTSGSPLVLDSSSGPDEPVWASDQGMTHLYATVSAPGAATIALTATNGSTTSNPTPGTVCLWATFPDGDHTTTVPLCNTTDAGVVSVSTYNPAWASYAGLDAAALAVALDAGTATGATPLPSGVPITLSVDHVAGTCPYAPGMLTAKPGAPASDLAPAGWSAGAVCSSFTWGLPSLWTTPTGTTALDYAGSSPMTVTLAAGTNQDFTLNWASPTLAPPAAGYAPDNLWAHPRTGLGCTWDGSCMSVLAPGAPRSPQSVLAPESSRCPEQFCFGP